MGDSHPPFEGHADAPARSRALCRDDDQGATAVEYAIMAVLVGVAVVVTVAALGLALSDIFGNPTLLDALTP